MFLGITLPDKSIIILGFNIIFVGILLLTFIRGFFRGFRKSIFYTLFFALGAIGLWFAIFPLAKEIYTMDLSFTGAMDSNLQNFILENINNELGYAITEESYSYDAINGIATCVLQVVLFFVFIVFWLIIYRFIVWFFWGILGYPFLKTKKVIKPSKEDKALAKTIQDKKQRRELLKPKVVRKKKHRLLGGVVGLVNGFVMCIVLCIPIGGVFSIITSANEAAQITESNTAKRNANSNDGDIPKDIQEFLEYGDVYDRTWMAQLLDVFGEDGLDNQMFDELFNIEVNKDQNVKLRKEINTLANFALEASKSGILEVETNELSLEVIKQIDEEHLVASFETLGDLELLDVVLNIGIDYLQYSNYINEHEVLKNLVIEYDDLRSIKLSQDIENIGKLVGTTIDILKDQEDLNNIDYMSLNTEKLNTFVDDLFNIELVNTGINTGLSYVLNLESVVDFVGDHQVNYENINWKEDFTTIINMYKEFVDIGIRFDGEESISMQVLSSNSEHIQNIIDDLYSLDVFNEVKDVAVDFALTELEKKEDIAKYIPEEVFTQLKNNGSETLYTELSTIINLFKDLGEQTTLLTSLDSYLASEDENAKFVLDVKPELAYILSDYIEQSSIATPIVLNFAEISNDSIQESMKIDLYDALSNVEDLGYELRIVGHILEGIEDEGGNINEILTEMTASENIETIDLALIDGIVNEEKTSYKDEEGNTVYYVDESVLLKRIIGPILDEAMKDILNGEAMFTNDDFVWSSEVKMLSEVADKLSETNGTEGKLNIAELKTSFETKIHIDIIEVLNDNASESMLIGKLINVALAEVVDEETLNSIEEWDKELNAFYQVGTTLVDENGYLVIAELQSLDKIKTTTIDVASTVVNDSKIIQHFFKEPLIQIGVNVDDINNWNEELTGLYEIADTIAVVDDNGDRAIDINNIETQLQDEIPLATLEAATNVFENVNVETVILRTILTNSLKNTITEDGFFDNWDNAKWYTELFALTSIADTLATGEDGNKKLQVADISNMKVLYISTLDSMVATNVKTNESNIDSSDILQYMAKQGFSTIIGEEKTNLIGTEGYPLWSDEVVAIKAMTIGNTYSNDKGEYVRLVEEVGVDEVTIDKKLTSDSSDKVKWSIIYTASNYVEKSLVLQTILEEPFKTMLEEEALDWDGSRWKIEVSAVADVTEELQDSEGYVSTTINTDKISVIVLQKASENTQSLIIRKMMSDTLTPMYAVEDESEIPATWDDNRWEKEIVALYEIAVPLQNDDGYIDISISFLHRTVKLSMFDAMEEYISNSTVLQSKIAQEVYTENGARLSGTPVVAFGSEEWHNEMMAIDQILHTIPEEDSPDASVSYDNLDFVNIKFTSLEAARDNIHRSVFIQHKMYVSLVGMVLEDEIFAQYEFSTEAQWYNEVDVIVDISKAYAGEGTDRINLDTIYFGGSIKFTVLDVMRDDINRSTFIQNKFRNALYKTTDGYILGTPDIKYGETKWLYEAIAIDESAKILAHGEDSISLSKYNFSNDNFGLPVDLISTLMVYTDHSVYLQDKLILALDGIVVASQAQNGVQVGEQIIYPMNSSAAMSTYWYKELEALNYVALELAGSDGIITTDTIDFDNGISMSLISTMQEYIHHSTYLQAKLEASLYSGYNVKPEILFSLTSNQWSEELDAIHKVGVAWFGENGTINPTSLGDSLDTGFPIAVLEQLSYVVDTSLYFQNQLQPKLIAMAPSGYYTVSDIPVSLPSVSNNQNANWTNDVTALYIAMNSISTDGNVQFNLSFENEIKYSLLTALVTPDNGETPIIGKSKLLQSLLKDTIDTLGTIDQNRTDIVGTEFEGFGMNLGYEGSVVSGKEWTITEQWITELGAIVTIAESQVNAEGNIDLSNLSADNFDREFLEKVIEILDTTNTTTYGMPVVIRSLMIPVLEEVSRVGITFEDGYNWSTTDTITSDLQYLLEAFIELGFTTIDQFNKDNINSVDQANNLITEYGSKSILIKAIAEKIISDLLAI